MDPKDIMLSKINQQRTNIIQFHLHEVPKADKFIETEIRVLLWGLEGGGSESLWLMSTEFQFCKMKTVLEVGGGHGCPTS